MSVADLAEKQIGFPGVPRRPLVGTSERRLGRVRHAREAIAGARRFVLRCGRSFHQSSRLPRQPRKSPQHMPRARNRNPEIPQRETLHAASLLQSTELSLRVGFCEHSWRSDLDAQPVHPAFLCRWSASFSILPERKTSAAMFSTQRRRTTLALKHAIHRSLERCSLHFDRMY